MVFSSRENGATSCWLAASSDHIVAQQVNRYIVAFHIAYHTLACSGLNITGGL